MSSSTTWTVLIATSALCLAIKLFGHYVPERWLANARLSALVVAEGLVTKTHVVIDHRLAGLVVALGALLAKAPFPVVVVGAAVTSALVYHLH